MQAKEVLKEIEKTVECLYQNKEREALIKAEKLLHTFECLAKNQAKKKDGSVLHVISFIKDFIENYNYTDMIGMADCLLEKGYGLIETYGIEQSLIEGRIE